LDIAGSGELSGTSWTPTHLPSGSTVWARLWTEVNGAWRVDQDISFTTAPGLTAAFTYPINGATGVDYSKPFTWSAAAGAQRYNVYLGTSQGALDIAGSGELSGTSWTPTHLPSGSTVWARLWTEVNGAWRVDQDISFTTAPGI
jgi:hypothetical protein